MMHNNQSERPSLESNTETFVSRPIHLARVDRVSRGMARQIMLLPNTSETQDDAIAERNTFNGNEITIAKLRVEMSNSALSDESHSENEQLEAKLIRQNGQIKKGRLSLSEIQGTKQPASIIDNKPQAH